MKRYFISIILPTYNRSFCIENAINSLLNQSCQDYELIIIDDGSTDNTKQILEQKYLKYFQNKKFKYKYIKHQGVCKARNVGLSIAKSKWIGYLDSDNVMKPDFIEEFKNAILKNKNYSCFYAQIIKGNEIIGNAFDFNELIKNNFIDMGVFVHKKSLIFKYGKFDEKLKRFVDWDLIIRYTRHKKPYFIDKVLLEYCDDSSFNRISNIEDLGYSYNKFLEKINDYQNRNKILIYEQNNHKVFSIFGIKIKFRKK